MGCKHGGRSLWSIHAFCGRLFLPANINNEANRIQGAWPEDGVAITIRREP